MPTPIDIQVIQTGSGDTLDQADKKIGGMTEHLGMNRREWMRTGNEAVYYATLISGKAGAMGGEIAKATGFVTQLGESFMFGGGVGIAISLIGTAISYVVGEIQKAEVEAQKFKESFDSMRMTLADLGKLTPDLAQKIKDLYGVSSEVAVKMAGLAERNEAYRQSLSQLTDAEQKKFEASKNYIAELDLYKIQIATVDDAVKRGSMTEERAATIKGLLVKQLNDVGDAYLKQVSATQQLRDANLETVDALAEQEKRGLALVEANKKAADSDDYWTRQQKVLRDGLKSTTDAIVAAGRAADTYLDSLASKVASTMRSATSAVINAATSVTAEDLGTSAMGEYIDKWDEYRRRLEAIQSGTSLDTYGDKFKQFVSGLNMSIGEAIAGMKDFSAFADSGFLANFAETGGLDAAEAQIKKQLDAIVGKEMLTRKAMEKVWADLSVEKQTMLMKMGYDETGALNQMIKTDIIKNPNFDKNLQKIVNDFLAAFPASIEVTVSGSVPGAAVNNPNSNGTQGGSSGAIAYANGGFGSVSKSGYIWIDRGEQFWASGTQNQVPPPSAPQNITLTLDGMVLARVVAGKIQSRR